ncbi:hypothetical protein [Streptomyces sp. MUM 16J]|uniref:hypothetical protein n=1 Tax=Streptomyces sp. MUM 16J TaxID=2791988 RepID=UPI001F04781A|nr:hypothetical protein [Streptomyces sp. MUM 16J]
MTGFDMVQLSYDEPLADALHTRLTRVLGSTTKRLHGVRGMRRAYRLTAELVDTEQFFLADGDFAIDPEFPATTVEPLAEGVSMRVWRAINPVNGLTYGYGGLKLIRATALREMGQAVDVLAALPGRVEFSRRTAGITPHLQRWAQCPAGPQHQRRGQPKRDSASNTYRKGSPAEGRSTARRRLHVLSKP